MKALLYILLAWSQAETLENRFLRHLKHAHRGFQVDNLHSAYARLKVADLACEIQLNEERVPSACYESLSLRQKLGIEIPARKKAKRLRQLDEVCLRAAEQLKTSPGQDSFVSAECAQKIRQSQEIQDYRGQAPDTWSDI